MKNKKTASSAGGKVNDNKSVTDEKTTQKIIKSHQLAAAHFMAAAKQHLAAAKNYEDGNINEAVHSTVIASGHDAIAGEFVSDAAKHHAQELKQTLHHF